ncbi:MAG: ParB/RepB/Spo0J family partition protein [Legionella sp.]
MQGKLQYIAIDCLQRSIFQPRQTFDPDTLQELAQSIRSQGLIEPLIVRAIGANCYEIIAGERRWRAAMLANLHELPCFIGDYTDQQVAAITLIENIQRQELNLLEEAAGYQRLLSDFNYQQDEIASLVGKSRSHIANILRLVSLCPFVQDRLRQRQLSLGHARMLVALPAIQQEKLARLTIDQSWSVRKLEHEVRRYKLDEQARKTQLLTNKNQDISYLEIQLAEQVGAPVSIEMNNQCEGWLKIKFFDNDTLTGLLQRFGLHYD